MLCQLSPPGVLCIDKRNVILHKFIILIILAFIGYQMLNIHTT